MAATATDTMKDRVREYFLLERAVQRSATLSPPQLEAIRQYYDAALRRLTAAQDLRGPNQTAAALSLYRQGGLFLALAYLISRDSSVDPESMTIEEAFDKLEASLDVAELRPPPEFERTKPLFRSVRLLELDQLAADEATRKADELEVATRWLANLVDPRSPREIKVDRGVRLAIASAVLLGFLALVGYSIFAPRNLALKRPVAATSVAFGTTPEGAVDGDRSGRFGFHSGEEDSPALTIDLGQPHSISKIKVFGRSDAFFDQSIPLALEVSDDGVTFRKIGQRTEIFSESEPWVLKPSGVTARMVRVRVERRSYLVLTEVEVYGKKAK